MKKSNFTTFGMLALTLCFAACSSDSDGNGGGSTPSGTYLKAKVNGTQFQTLEIQGQSLAVANKTGSGANTLIMIQGSGDMTATNSMVINLIGITETGTYNITPDDDGNVLAYVENANTKSYDTSNCEGATGVLKITALTDTKIEGTFSFTGKDDENCSDTRSVTDGSFRGVFMN